MKRITIAFVVTVLLFAVVTMPGCNNSRKIPNKIPTDFDYGSWTGSTYRNDFFGFSITVPENWYVSGKEEMKAIIETGRDMLDISSNEEMSKRAKIADVTSANLFFTARFSNEEAMEREVSNPNIVLIAENLSSLGKKIERGEYVTAMRQNLGKAIPGLIIKSQHNKTIGGHEFTSLQVQFSIEGTTINQEQLLCLKNDFALCFGLTTLDDSEKKQLDDIMATLKWD